MKRFIQLLSIAAVTVGALAFVAAPIPQAQACEGVECVQQGANKANTGGGSASTLDQGVRTVVNILLFLIGAVAVIMLVIGGIKYTTSNGDMEKVKSAKNTILYAIIGVVVAILAYAAVDFVIEAFA